MDVKEFEAALQELLNLIGRDRDMAIQRNPNLRRDYDSAMAAAESTLEQVTRGNIPAAKNMWTRNPALRAMARRYDAEFERITALLQ